MHSSAELVHCTASNVQCRTAPDACHSALLGTAALGGANHVPHCYIACAARQRRRSARRRCSACAAAVPPGTPTPAPRPPPPPTPTTLRPRCALAAPSSHRTPSAPWALALRRSFWAHRRWTRRRSRGQTRCCRQRTSLQRCAVARCRCASYPSTRAAACPLSLAASTTRSIPVWTSPRRRRQACRAAARPWPAHPWRRQASRWTRRHHRRRRAAPQAPQGAARRRSRVARGRRHRRHWRRCGGGRRGTGTALR